MSKFFRALEQAEHERVSASRTPRGVLAETLSQMDAAKAVGIVFNGLDTGRYDDLHEGPSARGRWGAQRATS
jgi:hypothetical protein